MTNFESENRLKKLYSSLGLDVSDATVNYAEIYAFSTGIEFVKSTFDELFSKAIWSNFNIATENALDSIMNFDSNGMSDDSRKAQIEHRLKRRFGAFSLNEFKERLKFYSSSITCTNTKSEFAFDNLPNSKDLVRKINLCINGYLPIFAKSSFSSSPLTFEQWDNMALTVNEIDRLVFRFDNIETWGGLTSE